MPAVADAEYVKLQEAKDSFVRIIADEQERKDNAIENGQAYSQGIKAYLENNLMMIKTTIEKIKAIKEDIRKAGGKGAAKALPVIKHEQELLNSVIQRVIDYLDNYQVILTQLFVRTVSKYRILLDHLENIESKEEVRKKMPKPEQKKFDKKLELMRQEYKDFDILTDTLSSVTHKFIERANTALPSGIGDVKSYEGIAVDLENVVRINGPMMEKLGILVQKITTLRFNQAMQMAHELTIYVEI